MLPKFFYSHTFKRQVLQWFLGFIILKVSLKFLNYGLRIFARFLKNGILLLRSIWWILKRRGSVRRRLNMWRRTMLKSFFSWWILNEHVEGNNVEELVQLVDFEDGGSVWILRGMNMWGRMMLRSLFSW
jgi:hypothetical protein